MFGLNMYQCAASGIDSYAEALSFHDSCKAPRLSVEGDERRLRGKESSKQMGVRVDRKGNVCFRYHSTDVVVWHPDNSWTVDSYSSRATCTFADCFLPMSVNLTDTGSTLRIGEWLYPVYDRVTHKADGTVVQHNPRTRFTRQVIDRPKAKALLAETNYADYVSWHNAIYPMVRDTMPGVHRRPYLRPEAAIQMVADKDSWHGLMQTDAGMPNTLRKMIYDTEPRFSPHYPYRTELAERLPRNSRGSAKPWKVRLMDEAQ